ncbi:hypothetical protein [Actinomadura macrotermitis]|uniref:Glycosyltransferase RgtA/B/C/D-like domain-containing protein n=1 Tax=Actinomadura macrotermitis TaxID=2585200 RepID=A0A7K0BSB6_9ACTN|nr:hypothetical protein [Actinomadura macrotermitis]MQY04037.1 hypothetical protein [Actinomadura macrotermitis]
MTLTDEGGATRVDTSQRGRTGPGAGAPVKGMILDRAVLRRRAGGPWRAARRHPLFAVILAIAAALRVITMIGYTPAMYFNDSFDYLHVAMRPYPHPLRPDGYSFLLLALKPFHSFALVAAVQHLMGLAMGVMIYALLRRRFRLPRWGAALATVPVLLDAYQIQLEHLVLSDTQFTFLVVTAVTLLLWRDRPSWKIAAAVGLIIGLSWLTRSVGLPVLLGVLVFMLVARMGWRTLAVTMAACALPVLGYMSWYKADSGKFTMTESNGIFLFARTYKFADCHKIKMKEGVPVEEMFLCTEPQNRLPNSQDGIWANASPLNRYVGERFSAGQNKVANDFAKRAIKAQPLDYGRVVAHDFFRVFQWKRTVFPDPATYQLYEFRKRSSPLPNWRMDSDHTAADEATAYERGNARTRVVEPFAGIMRAYQDWFYLRGTMVGVLLLAGLAGLLALWRPSRAMLRPRTWLRPAGDAERGRSAAFLPWSLATGLLLAPAATAEFDYRYVLPAVPLACIAAAVAFSPQVRARFAGLRPGRAAATAVPSTTAPSTTGPVGTVSSATGPVGTGSVTTDEVPAVPADLVEEIERIGKDRPVR